MHVNSALGTFIIMRLDKWKSDGRHIWLALLAGIAAGGRERSR